MATTTIEMEDAQKPQPENGETQPIDALIIDGTQTKASKKRRCILLSIAALIIILGATRIR